MISTTGFFSKKVDRRSRLAMVAFLTTHFRYDTLRSWNGITSYAHNIKLHRLGLSGAQLDKAYELLDVDIWEEINSPIERFREAQDGYYTIGVNGRSGGYLVLHECELQLTGHLSYCLSCGQRNFKKVPPHFEDKTLAAIAQVILQSKNPLHAEACLEHPCIRSLSISDAEKLAIVRQLKIELYNCSSTDTCGRCGQQRCNYTKLPQVLMVRGSGIDQYEEFYSDEWSLAALRNRVDLVCAFDAACNEIRRQFIALLADYKVVETTEYQPVKIKRLMAA